MNVDQITTLSGKDPDETAEHHGSIDWKPFEAQEISDQFSEYIPVSDDQAEQPYKVIDQFLAAAKGQPGITFGFRAGVGLPKVYLKFDDGQFFLGQAKTDDNFAGINGNDGDNDEDDMPLLPSPGAGGKVESRNDVARIVESLIGPPSKPQRRKSLSEAEINRIALALLES